jgi:hypothetical protein
MHFHIHCMNDRSKFMQLLLGYGLRFKQSVQLIILLLNLIEFLLFVQRFLGDWNFFIE